MPTSWNEIRSDYEKAKSALWCPEGAAGWHRDEGTGWYYMWKAFHEASAQEGKDQLLYARILAMMASECRIRTQDYDRYHRYVKPALDAYILAEQAGQQPGKEEMQRIRFEAESLAYELERQDLPFEEQIKPITGHENLNDFSFHDSKPVRFEQFEESARLSLQYGDVTATFLFEGVLEVHVESDPRTNWIGDFSCYPCFPNNRILTFDVGYYRIICERISVECVRSTELKKESCRKTSATEASFR